MEDRRPDAVLPEHLEKARTRVGIEFKKVTNPIGTYGSRTYDAIGYDNSLDMAQFVQDCKVRILEKTNEELVFDLVGLDAPLANAMRRVLLAEVPTIAIENVFFHDNTSIMHDEMIAHRLGLVPLLVDPAPFETWEKGMPVTARNTVKFRLKVECDHASSGPRDPEAPPEVLYDNSSVTTGMITHVPMEGQEHMLQGSIPRPVHGDIVLAKMRPGQAIHVECDATKNVGREHAKWSPVATAAYRMLPEITLKREVEGSEAVALKELCPMNVFDIEDGCAAVARPRQCTMCRECVRGPEREEMVELSRKRQHFVFSVESVGQLPAGRLVEDALDVLVGKIDVVEKALKEVLKEREPPVVEEDAEEGNDDEGDEDDEEEDDEEGEDDGEGGGKLENKLEDELEDVEEDDNMDVDAE